eukprot:TRINITY_DN4255_c0_g1_i1.p2 TRINITY_DN4255_c0_g1~~TRINITY_DN4255_c0_g1_i1.p2  ORF type:complete len:229 (+),score=-8.57 TRINITY_DN4255_c0_g1_i1:257-943(+)
MGAPPDCGRLSGICRSVFQSIRRPSESLDNDKRTEHICRAGLQRRLATSETLLARLYELHKRQFHYRAISGPPPHVARPFGCRQTLQIQVSETWRAHRDIDLCVLVLATGQPIAERRGMSKSNGFSDWVDHGATVIRHISGDNASDCRGSAADVYEIRGKGHKPVVRFHWAESLFDALYLRKSLGQFPASGLHGRHENFRNRCGEEPGDCNISELRLRVGAFRVSGAA